MKDDMEYCRIRLTTLYQRYKRELFSLEVKYAATPLKILELEIIQQKGMLKGLEKAIALFEKRSVDNQLPGLG